MPVRQYLIKNSRVSLVRRIVLPLLVLAIMAQAGPFAVSRLVAGETVMDRTGTITVSAANIRTGPGTTFDRITTLNTGHFVNVLAVTTGQFISGFGDQWYKVSFVQSGQTLTGYVVAGFVTLIPLPDPEIIEIPVNHTGIIAGTNSVNVRSGPGTSHALITTLNRNDAVEILSQVQGQLVNTLGSLWYRIRFSISGTVMTGFVVAAHVSFDPVESPEFEIGRAHG